MSNKPVIVFEGIEGSGKSHHILNVSKYLKKKYCNKSLEFRNEKLKNGEEQWEFFRQIALNCATDAHLIGIFVLDIQIFHT